MPVGHFFSEAHQGIDLLHLVHVTAIGDAFPDPLQLVRGKSQYSGDGQLLGHACISCISTHETSKRSGSAVIPLCKSDKVPRNGSIRLAPQLHGQVWGMGWRPVASQI
ncbi:hypothetical protein MES4922_210258 [Mesorhizobium ventifaucium]|uniref:Uncharacterized protein n=1 Tax=Mesorhizobium ventifaucium TaxID=666020 RepID=A0ABN8JN30_9HYPH|nr:hypothetical protein MES4922_210258 [Mesorhizobium ventifaucium]